MGEFSPMHWLIVLVVALLIFGPKRIPEIAKSLGEGIREFKKSMREGMAEPPAAAKADAKAEPAQIESKGEPTTKS
jgi:sec-independent protein translocase protein TatA